MDLARIFVLTGQTVVMKTQPASRAIDLLAPRSKPSFSEAMNTREISPVATRLAEEEHKAARRDALSFSISFAVIAVLTGAMLLYKVAVTMSTLTSFFFYGSLAGMLFFAVRAILLARPGASDAGDRD